MQGTVSTIEDALVKKFNKIPKNLRHFYTEMEEGDECLPRFEDLPDKFKRDRHTKGTYSKRKAIHFYVKNYQTEQSAGAEACLSSFESVSSFQLYERIKKSRHTQ